MSKNQKILFTNVLLLALAVGAWWLWSLLQAPGHSAVIPDAQQEKQVATAVAALWNDSEARHAWRPRGEAVYLAVRRDGRRLTQQWAVDNDLRDALTDVFDRAKAGIARTQELVSADTLEVVIADDFETVDPKDRKWSTNIHRGIKGFELSYKGQVERYSPTYMLATNRDTRRLIQLFGQRHALDREQMQNEVIYRRFDAEQWLVFLNEDQPRAVRMHRGNTLVPVETVSQASTSQLGELATLWMRNNLHDDGRMTYKYWPSARQESEGNNMIRQWMATIALIRAAKHWDDAVLMEEAGRNIDYNLKHFYREENGYGLIEWYDKVKLGAVALAALALVEHPDAHRWASQEAALRRTTDYLWHEDGSYTTFFKPVGRNDIQNFYPGEALLYWAVLYERDAEPERLRRIMKSFEYYRDWHLNPRNRNPAFIPWHTQAYYKIWRKNPHEGLRDFIFTMNDWLIEEMQQWDPSDPFQDTQGRFYNPKRPYGPPHVSSTGVYLEGLIDAFELARELGDAQRTERYRLAIIRGLRSAMQLQFVDEVDMFYVPGELRRWVHGGMRTTVYNNEIRCDNVQHNLMGILKILQGFKPEDYRHPH